MLFSHSRLIMQPFYLHVKSKNFLGLFEKEYKKELQPCYRLEALPCPYIYKSRSYGGFSVKADR